MRQRTDKLIKERLEGLDTLSAGIVFDKEAAWKKLEQRVNDKSGRKTAVWYWMAAAAILVITFFILQQHPDQNTEFVKTATPQPVVAPESKLDNELGEIVIYKEEKKPKAEAPQQDNKLFTIHTDTPIIPKEILVVAPTIDTAVPKIAKRGLKVVHVNDLDNEQYIKPIHSQQQRVVKIKVPLVHINEPWEERYLSRRSLSNITLVHFNISEPSSKYKAADMREILPEPVQIKRNP